MVKYTFKKEERLCNKRLLTNLFQSGSSFVVYPYKVTFLKNEGLSVPVQVVISVPKRRFKKAVDRNLLKRRIREAYRLQKNLLYTFVQIQQVSLLFSLQYIGNEIRDYAFLYKKLEKVFQRVQDEYTKDDMGQGN